MAAVHSDYPDVKDLININLGKDYLPDPFTKKINQASRVITGNQAVLRKVEHNYTDSVKKQIQKTKNQGKQAVERKSMATEIGQFGRKTGQGFLFEEDAHFLPSGQFKMPAYSTA